ncbi:hypothetical protein K435DRAFT_430368 [Dendrothele bispora CBS 962.96]|uniref:F-box domain-containing protein n=1 Tax=Dendrothele bispora (strain CBS 962.96) TaxID=1314807 RepID=A0A4S8ME04_DENBC|nr:hypothetical protein K435DRAFT_430368 [Dendrothele bispora CBS 962.96]
MCKVYSFSMPLPHQCPTLPQELIDAIIDQLQDSRRDLLSCALVGHAWLPQSQKHLFQVISCGSELSKHGETSEDTLNRIARAPIFSRHIPPLVQRLSFDCVFSSRLLTMLFRISTFTQLRHLTLSNVPLRNLHHSTCTKTLSLPEFLNHCPTLEHLALVEVPMHDISQLLSPVHLRRSRLRSLALHSLTCTNDVDEQTEKTLSCFDDNRVELESLELKDVDPDLVDLLFCRDSSPFLLSSLKELSLGDDGFIQLLKQFVTGNDFRYDAIPFILSRLNRSELELQTLTLPVTFSAGYPEIESGHDKLICEFIRNTPSLERITLRLTRKSKLRYTALMCPTILFSKQRETLASLSESAKTGKLEVEIEPEVTEKRNLEPTELM